MKTLFAALVAALLSAGGLAGFLAKDAGFTASQWSAIDRGDVVVRELPTGDRTDVAVIGAARVARPAATLIDNARGAGSATARSSIHPFSATPSLADVAGLHFKPEEIASLSDCHPSSCAMKLSAADMAALSTMAAAETPEATERANEYLRRRMVEIAAAYHQRGNEGAPVYDDLGSVQSGRAFETVMARSCRICRVVPGDSSAGRLFWVMDSMPRVRPTLRVMHEFVAEPEPGVTAFVARQVYANHYFEAGVEMLIVVDDAVAHVTSAARGTLLISLRLYHFDQIPKLFIFDLRGRVVDRLEDAVVTDLKQRQR